MKKNILVLILSLLSLASMAIPIAASMSPVEVERVTDVCFFKIRGDHPSESFLLSYESLSPNMQRTVLRAYIFLPNGLIEPVLTSRRFVVAGSSWDRQINSVAGAILYFHLDVYQVGVEPIVVISDSIVIPPRSK